jgi:catechol 2,3-dioxygenase
MSPTETSSQTAAVPSLPATLRLGAVHLTVTDLDRSVAFYERSLGLRLRERDVDAASAALGAGEGELLVLVEDSVARPTGRHAGLYHYALLFDSREELARAVTRLATTRTPIQGASDHGVSEAIYLADPDGNGIELYADRPREQWPPATLPGARLGMFTDPLDLDALLGVVAGEQPREQAGPGLRMGHVHLHVNDIAAGLHFYRDVLGFELMVDLGTAEFVAAGGYHHHLGFNVWRGEGIPSAPESGTVGLRHWTVQLESADEVAAVRRRLETTGGVAVAEHPSGFMARDPAGIAVAFTVP